MNEDNSTWECFTLVYSPNSNWINYKILKLKNSKNNLIILVCDIISALTCYIYSLYRRASFFNLNHTVFPGQPVRTLRLICGQAGIHKKIFIYPPNLKIDRRIIHLGPNKGIIGATQVSTWKSFFTMVNH